MFEPETSITAKSFVLLAPAISPIYHNNPAFRLVSLDTDQLSLTDYTQYYMDLVMATGEFWFNKVNKDFSRVESFLCIRVALHFFHLLEKVGIRVICGIFLKYNPLNWPLLAASNLAIIVMNKLLLWNNERACHTHFTMNDIKAIIGRHWVWYEELCRSWRMYYSQTSLRPALPLKLWYAHTNSPNWS